jgi:hypothetical protein
MYLYWLDAFLTIGVHDMYVRGMAIMACNGFGMYVFYSIDIVEWRRRWGP